MFVPWTAVAFYREGDNVLFRGWIETLPVKARAKCFAYLRLLEQYGHELRRPVADYLRDGIYELRPTAQGVNYRILYAFAGKQLVVVTHGIAKKAEVPAVEIDRAIERADRYRRNPALHGAK